MHALLMFSDRRVRRKSADNFLDDMPSLGEQQKVLAKSTTALNQLRKPQPREPAFGLRGE